MSTSFTREQLMETAKASPVAVGNHDRDAWISLFATDYSVEDPVGSKPHVPGSKGRKPLQNFFDTFIAPNKISFEVYRDIVVGNEVVRDVTINLNMSAGVTAYVPMHATYEMIEESGVPKIHKLRAHWELFPMIRQVLGKGPKGLASFSMLGFRMMKIQGIGGALGFSKGFGGVHKGGKQVVNKFVEAANRADGSLLTSLFDEMNEGIFFPANVESVSPEAFCEKKDLNLSVSKLLSAGNFVSSTFSANDSKGVVIFEFSSQTKKIKSVRFYF